MSNPEMIKLLTSLDVNAVIEELERATKEWTSFKSYHEGYAIILEELEELWEAIRIKNQYQMKKEAIQVTAMALRFLLDFDKMEIR